MGQRRTPEPPRRQRVGRSASAARRPWNPLGTCHTAAYVDQTSEVPRGGSVLLYTDGLVERRSTSISDGLSRLESIRVPSSDPDVLCDHVLDTLLHEASPASDDITMLALQPSPS